MEFLLVLALVAVIALLMPKTDAPRKLADNQIVVEVKECPPHQWFYQEVLDQHGNPHGTRIVCKICGPYKS